MAPTALRCKTGLAYFEPSQHKGKKNLKLYNTLRTLKPVFDTTIIFFFEARG